MLEVAREVSSAEEKAKYLEEGWVPEFFTGLRPGDGLPGRVEAYASSDELTAHLKAHTLTARWFVRDPVTSDYYWDYDLTKPPPDRIPFLLHTPTTKDRKPVPLVLYFPGNGEVGTNLAAHFKQSTIFSKIASPAFQKENPCYLFAPMLPDSASFRSGNRKFPTLLSVLVCDAMYAVIRDARQPPVDTNRLYVTGLSFGGGAAMEMMVQWPGRFAACVPVENLPSLPMIPEKPPGNYWFIFNEKNRYKGTRFEEHVEELRQLIVSRGGECRVGNYPDEGHDAWHKAWQEDQVWQ